MTFLALNMNTCFLIGEKSDLEYEEMIWSNKYEKVTSEMADRQQELSSTKSSSTTSGSSNTLDNDPQLQEYKSEQDLYESKKESIESRLKIITAELESYQKQVDTNIKSECKLSTSG